jgi:putative ATP-dependent endonuclease of OLD family
LRSIKELDIELPQICALVGPNNAGKRNILRANQRVLGRDWVRVSSFDEDDVYGRDPSADAHIKLSFEPALSYTNFKGADPADICTLSFECTRYKIGEEKGQRRLEQHCFDAKGKPPMDQRASPATCGNPPGENGRHRYSQSYDICCYFFAYDML